MVYNKFIKLKNKGEVIMKRFKKAIASVLALSSVFSLCSFNKANAYYAGQKHTWRVYEKVSTLNLEWYSSTIVNKNNYTFSSSKPGKLIDIDQTNFSSKYDTSLKALITSYKKPPKINGTGYLSMSTWYTPTTVSNFSVQYSYETSNGAKITPIYVLVGDFNQDGYVNKLDANAIMDYYSSASTGNVPSLSEKALLAGDVNGDGYIDMLDASRVLGFAEGDDAHL